MISYILTFVAGIMFLAMLEVLVILYFLGRSRQRSVVAAHSSDDFNSPSKIAIQGDVWIAPVYELHLESACKQKQPTRKQKKDDLPEISISFKHAKIKEKNLILADDDGTVSMNLEGCSILAVSSGNSPARKWAKKYPIKIEHCERVLLDGSKICLLYLRTGWEKESWCEALRAAAKQDYNPQSDWYSKIKSDFRNYMDTLKQNFPLLLKFGSSYGKGFKGDTVMTKKSVSWKRLLKKSKSKTTRNVSVQAATDEEEEESSTKKHLTENVAAAAAAPADYEKSKLDYDVGNQSDTNADKKSGGDRDLLPEKEAVGAAVVTTKLDGGLVACNLLFSRLFFDLYHSHIFASYIQRRIQMLLTRVPTPNYIGPISCTHIDIGNIPPFVHDIRGLSIDGDGVWAVEADIEYSGGGALLTLETRLDMRESRVSGSDQQKVETSSAGAATTDIINHSLDSVEEDLETAAAETGSSDQADQTSGRSKSPSNRKRWTQQWKTLLLNVADQVSQVPLTLSMRVVSLKGTIQLRIRPPPSDRIWYAFTSMPELELVSEPSVGEHKISTGPVVGYIAERIQILIAETIVLPNSEDIYVPWMSADVEDWIEESGVPFPQLVNELSNISSKNEKKQQQYSGVVRDSNGSSSTASELKKPLLEGNVDTPDDAVAAEMSSPAIGVDELSSSSSFTSSSDDQKKKKGLKREKMLNLGKKMGEKLEEKKRLFAERLRERFDNQQQP